MLADPKHEGLIVSGNTTPVIRAGYSNGMFLLLPVWSVLINEVLKEFGIAPFIRGVVLLGFCLAGLKVYSHSLSRIFIKNGKTLVLVGAFTETEIDADDILETKVYALLSCMQIFLKVKRKTSSLPAFYHFIAPVTNYGGCADTRTKLLLLLKRLSHTEP